MTLVDDLAAALMREHGDRWYRMTIHDIADAAVAALAEMGRLTDAPKNGSSEARG